MEIGVDMLILVTYDVNTQSVGGQKRLRQVAKHCVNYGQRVQYSVFECSLDAAQYKVFKAELCGLIDEKKDSLRFYNLGNNGKNKIECFGVQSAYEAQGFLTL